MIDNVAKAMETRRRELIAQPLNRIWSELARAAIEAMREPNEEMIERGVTAEHGKTLGERVMFEYQAMIDAALKS